MPKALFAAFRATFEEAADADLLIELVDAADAEQEEQMQATASLLSELALDTLPRLRVFNKVDNVDADTRAALERDGSLTISAVDRSSARRLLDRIEIELARPRAELDPEPIQLGAE
jgi:GTP-binding protein HflX